MTAEQTEHRFQKRQRQHSIKRQWREWYVFRGSCDDFIGLLLLRASLDKLNAFAGTSLRISGLKLASPCYLHLAHTTASGSHTRPRNSIIKPAKWIFILARTFAGFAFCGYQVQHCSIHIGYYLVTLDQLPALKRRDSEHPDQRKPPALTSTKQHISCKSQERAGPKGFSCRIPTKCLEQDSSRGPRSEQPHSPKLEPKEWLLETLWRRVNIAWVPTNLRW
ncbi:hypothetical protein GX50_02242 [[Emmonsia] crescens]|uniref:Uncharacterized protein n=1 Tax=[Emmonsia] crescens TaxID=73230 RepID=A0A2B7ZND6_9EURO|nr:hypothetical protein GX50_02242 [Emmonsia crescens]